MEPNKMNTVATAVIAFTAISGLMVGLYFNLKMINSKMIHILISESLLIVIIYLFIWWILVKVKNE